MALPTEQAPSRRRTNAFLPRLMSISTVFVFLSILSAVLAYDMEADNRAYNSRQFKKLERLGQIHFDQRQPPIVPARHQRRDDVSSTTSSAESVVPSTTSTSISSTTDSSLSYSNSATTSASESASSTSSTSSTSSKGSTATTAAPTVITTSIPTPFDTSLGSNFTSQSCPDFFNSFLSNATFKSCTPVSLLLQNSNSFFQAERDAILLAETLNAACNAPLAICSPLMSALSQELISTSNCGADYSLQNPLVKQAYNGLVAYEPLYRATCLKNPATGSYCFSDAITNSSKPADSYPYYTALGLTMPTSSKLTCSKCLQNTMDVFADYAGDKDQPLATTYGATSYQIDMACGATFVNTTFAATTSGSAPNANPRGAGVGMLALGLATVAFIII